MSVEAVSSSASSVYENPKSKLGTDEFLQLFLTELKYQDPTEPMDNEKILTQTSQLSTLESNEELQTSLNLLATGLQSSSQFSIISAIGKTANTGNDSVQIEDGNSVNFSMLFKNNIDNGNIKIMDANNNTVKTIDLSTHQNSKGNLNFSWDATDNDGNIVDNGSYKIVASYLDINGKANTSTLGEQEIQSVKFDKGKAYLKLGSEYIASDEVKEIF